jgi:hypothetical protein
MSDTGRASRLDHTALVALRVLLNLRTGGEGLNLPGAATVPFVDPMWMNLLTLLPARLRIGGGCGRPSYVIPRSKNVSSK